MVVTDDEELAARVVALRQYGWGERPVSATTGMNSRLDALQAAILGVKLVRLDADNARRRAIAALYDDGLAGTGLVLPLQRVGATHVFHQYVVRHARRDRLQAALRRRDIGTGIHYPVPVHLQPAYAGRIAIGPGGLTRSARAAIEVLSLPIYPQLADEAVGRVIAAIRDALRETG